MMLERLENQFQLPTSQNIIEEIMTVIYCSRKGLSELEIIEMLDVSFFSFFSFLFPLTFINFYFFI